MLHAVSVSEIVMTRYQLQQVRAHTRRLFGDCVHEICNFSQCRCNPSGRKGRPKLTGYARLSLDETGRRQDFTCVKAARSNRRIRKEAEDDRAVASGCAAMQRKLL
jgi:hypothetical protein